MGAAKFLRGLIRVIDPASLHVVGNVGDNIWMFGLYVAPDIDIVTYALADVWDESRGWGLKGEAYQIRDSLRLLGLEEADWFNLGDRDFATCVYRTYMMKRGHSLSEVTDMVARRLGVKAKITPATDDELVTEVHTQRGWISFEEYYVRYRSEPPIDGIRFLGADKAQPAPGVIDAIRTADKIIVCPSNPLASIKPILSVGGVADALREQRHRVLAISPLVGGRAVKGPADSMLRQLNYEPSVLGVAKVYRDFVGKFIIDVADRGELERLSGSGVDMEVFVFDTLMRSVEDSVELARRVMSC